jgi:hypothetical protein
MNKKEISEYLLYSKRLADFIKKFLEKYEIDPEKCTITKKQ